MLSLSLSLLGLCLSPGLTSAGVTTSTAAITNQTFDYIVVGGGLTGTTVAARLAEDPSVTVLVIEAGQDNRRDPRVYDIYKSVEFFNSTLNWAWPADQGRIINGSVDSFTLRLYLSLRTSTGEELWAADVSPVPDLRRPD